MVRFDTAGLLRTRRIVGYGASLALLGTRRTRPLPLAYVVDDTPALIEQEIDGVPIYPTSRLAAEARDDLLVVLFAYKPQSLRAMSARLDALGLRYGEHYLDCSFLHYESIARRLEDRLGLVPSYERFWASRLLTLYAAPRNLSAIAGTWLFVELAEHLLARAPGEVVECGVYDGGNAFVALLVSAALRARRYRLCDSFAGFPELSPRDPAERAGEFADVDFAAIRNRFANFANVVLHRGTFERVLPALPPSSLALVYVDCDLYESTRVCCRALYDRVAPGGAMLFHDYWTPDGSLPEGAPAAFTGVRRAVDEFLPAWGVEPILFPETTHALVVKP